MSLAIFLSLNLLVVLSLFAILWTVAQKTKDPSFVDAFWAFAITLIAVISCLHGQAGWPQKILITGLSLIWGLRLGLHLFVRWKHEGADRRYSDLIRSVREKRGWSFGKTTALFIFLPQAVLLWVTALPVQLGQFASVSGISVGFWIGVGLALFGLAFEAIADEQLRQFKSNPDNAGLVMDRGLWAWSRHPNYFGETLFWWGLYLMAAQTWIGAASIIGPLFVTFTLTRWSGIPLLEKTIHTHRPGYADYASRTSAFIPRLPRR